MRKKYASDIGPEKFAQILPVLQSVRKRTKPTTVDLYEVFCAVLYVLRTGCQWRFLPSDFPKWQSVYSYFAKWRELGEDGNSALELALRGRFRIRKKSYAKGARCQVRAIDRASTASRNAENDPNLTVLPLWSDVKLGHSLGGQINAPASF